MRLLPTTALLLALCLAACGSAPSATSASHNTAPHAAWSYSGASGPEFWGTLDPGFIAAKEGREQSPVDIDPASAVRQDLTALEFHYAAGTVTVKNTGHDILRPETGGSYLMAEGQRWDLLQLHFHTPSEHTLGGTHAEMEMHLVHQNAAKELLVVGVLLRAGKANAAFDAIWDNMPTTSGQTVETATLLDPLSLLPPEGGRLVYYRYDGSLTTPPCTENVRWFVMQEPVQLSAEQIARYRAIHNGTNRPTQPLNDRTITTTR